MLTKKLDGDGELLESEAETGGAWIAGPSAWLVVMWRVIQSVDLRTKTR